MAADLTPGELRATVESVLRNSPLSVLVRQLQSSASPRRAPGDPISEPLYIQATTPVATPPWAWIDVSVDPPALWVEDGV